MTKTKKKKPTPTRRRARPGAMDVRVMVRLPAPIAAEYEARAKGDHRPLSTWLRMRLERLDTIESSQHVIAPVDPDPIGDNP